MERIILFNNTSVDHLIRVSRKSKKVLQAVFAYREPPMVKNTTLGPDLTGDRYPRTTPTVSAVALTPNSSQLRCWNCREPNYSWRDCPKPLAIYCYGCGQVGTTAYRCARCRSRTSKNAMAGRASSTSASTAH